MKISDLWRLAAKTLSGRWVLLPAIGFAVAAFSLSFAGAILVAVQEEKMQPYELILAPDSAELSDSAVAQVSGIEDVKAATAVLELPVAITAGEHKEELTLTGLDAAYLDIGFVQGGFFPDDSVMPYVVLNAAASELFSDETGKAYGMDTLNDDFSVQMGEGAKPIAAKVCGILAQDEEAAGQPAAYISLSVAKKLLRQSGQNADYTKAYVRVTNIGSAAGVSKAAAMLGLVVRNSTEELQAGWDNDMLETTYLIVIGVFCLVCASVVLAAHRAVMREQQKEALAQLRWMGMRSRTFAGMFQLQAGMICAVGAVVGLVVSNAIPSFLEGAQGTSSFTLPIPFAVSVICLAVCLLAGVVPALFDKERQPQL